MIDTKLIEFAGKISLLRNEAMRLGLYRTSRLLEIPQIEIGWEMQKANTPQPQQNRQQKILTP